MIAHAVIPSGHVQSLYRHGMQSEWFWGSLLELLARVAEFTEIAVCWQGS